MVCLVCHLWFFIIFLYSSWLAYFLNFRNFNFGSYKIIRNFYAFIYVVLIPKMNIQLEKLENEKQELQTYLEMYGQECFDTRYDRSSSKQQLYFTKRLLPYWWGGWISMKKLLVLLSTALFKWLFRKSSNLALTGPKNLTKCFKLHH